MMDKNEYINLLLKFASASLGIMGVFVMGVVIWARNKIEAAATKSEVAKVESDLKEMFKEHKLDRQRRDDAVDDKLARIEDVVTRTHVRIDALFNNGLGHK